jgi:threonine dehydratase
MRASKPGVKVFAAEPETAAPFSFSLKANEPSYFPDWRASFVDGAGGHSVLRTMWPLLRQWTDGSIVVSLGDVRHAMRLAAERARVIAEGAGACAIAAALKPDVGTGKIVAVVSGGNIDLHKFSELVDE